MAIDKFLTSRQILFFSFLASTIVGCFIAWFAPPFANPDEGAHYLRAYEVSRGHWVNSRGDVGVDILCSDYLIVAKKYAPVAYYQIEAEAMKPDAKSCHVSTVNTAGNYSPVPYLAAAIGIKIGKFFDAEVENRLRIGRLFNMILTSFICLLAIMWLPNVGVVLAFFALIPAGFFLRASLSADALTLSFCLIYVGYIIFLLQKNANVNALIILKLSFLAVLLGSMKPVYGILALITFLLFRPSDHFWHSFKNFCVLTVPSLSALLAGSLWILLADPELVYINKFGGANPVLQTKWIVEHPFTFLNTILQTFRLQSYDFVSQSVWPTLAAQQPVTVAIRNSIIGIFVLSFLH